MNLRPPRFSGTGESTPVFDFKARTAHGTLHIRRYRRDADPACFCGLAPIVRLWQGRLRGDALPRWSDFGIEDFVGWHRYVALSDLAEDDDLRFRIFGTGAAELMGADLTGKKLTAAFPSSEADGVLDHFAAIRNDKVIRLLASNVARPGLEHRIFKVVELPLEIDNGDVGQVLHVFLTSHGRG